MEMSNSKKLRLQSKYDGGLAFVEVSDDKVIFFIVNHSPLLMTLINKVMRDYGCEDLQKVSESVLVCQRKNMF